MAKKDLSLVTEAILRWPTLGGTITSNVNRSTFLHGLYSHDEDNQFLTYSWRLVHAPAGSSLSRSPILGAWLEFTPDVTGDYFFELHVSDGDSIQSATTKVEVSLAGVDVNQGASTTYGALEVIAPDGGQLNYEISAESTAWYEDREEDSVRWILEKPFNSSTQTDLALMSDSFITELNSDRSLAELIKVHYSSNTGGGGVLLNTGTSGIELHTVIAGGHAKSVYSEDFNLDGHIDLILLVADPEGSNQQAFVDVWLSDGEGRYQQHIHQLTGYHNLTIGDLNSDGLPDIVTSSLEGLSVSFQNEQGYVDAPILYGYASEDCTGLNSVRPTAIGDYNGDGRNDLLAIQPCDGRLSVWLQGSDGTLGAPVTIDLGVGSFGQVTFNHFNADNRIDIALGNGFSPGYMRVLINNETGFTVTESYANQGLGNAPAVSSGDFTGDGRADLAHFDGRYIHFYEQQEEGAFTLYSRVDNAKTGISSRGYFADIDGDGHIDLAVANNYQLSVYMHRDGGFSTTDFGMNNQQTWPEAITVMDYNQDGRKDIVVPSQSTMVFFGGLHLTSHPVP